MSEEERVKQLVEFLSALVDDRFKEKFTQLSKAQKGDVIEFTQKLEDWALDLGVSEQKQLQIGKLLGILNDPDDEFYEQQFEDISTIENNNSYYNYNNDNSNNNNTNNYNNINRK